MSHLACESSPYSLTIHPLRFHPVHGKPPLSNSFFYVTSMASTLSDRDMIWPKAYCITLGYWLYKYMPLVDIYRRISDRQRTFTDQKRSGRFIDRSISKFAHVRVLYCLRDPRKRGKLSILVLDNLGCLCVPCTEVSLFPPSVLAMLVRDSHSGCAEDLVHA